MTKIKDMLKEFEVLTKGVSFATGDHDIQFAANKTELEYFLETDSDDRFLYLAMDRKGREGEYDSLSFDETIKLRDYLTKIIELKG